MRKDTPVETRPGEAVIWTDGACSGNPGPGGWAAILVLPDGEVRELSGGEGHTTNNRMEFQAVIEGLKALPDDSPVAIVTDWIDEAVGRVTLIASPCWPFSVGFRKTDASEKLAAMGSSSTIVTTAVRFDPSVLPGVTSDSEKTADSAPSTAVS